MKRTLIAAGAMCITILRVSGHYDPQAPAQGAITPGPVAPGGVTMGRGVAMTGTAVIRGIVLTPEGAPLRGARVRVGDGPPGSAPVTATDEQGRYEVSGLPPGRHTVTASKTGYVTLSYGQRRSLEAPRPLDLANGQTLDRIDFHLPRGGVIVVRVTDDLGDPIAAAAVQAEYYTFANGIRRLAAMDVASTDERGEARLSELPPGTYFVSADKSRSSGMMDTNDSGRKYLVTYSPDAVDVTNARRVTVEIGTEVTADVRLVTARVARISGVLRTSEGTAPTVRPTFSLQWRGPSIGINRSMPLQPDGSFVLGDVAPGDYTLVAGPGTAAGGPREFGRLPITVGGDDLSGLVVTTMKAGAVHGQIVFDTGVAPPTFQASVVQFTGAFTADGGSGRFTTNSDWSFDAVDLNGTGVLRLRQPVPGWFMKSVLLDGKDVIDTPTDFTGRTFKELQVVFTQKRADLSGTAADAKGIATTDYVAVVFPEDRSQWTPTSRYIQAARPDQQGQFRMAALPPGRYLAVALDYLPPGQERDPELLNRLLAGASRVTLDEGDSRTVSLRVGTY